MKKSTLQRLVFGAWLAAVFCAAVPAALPGREEESAPPENPASPQAAEDSPAGRTETGPGEGPSAKETAASAKEQKQPEKNKKKKTGKASVYVIPIEDAISKPNHFILRRGLKEAIDNDIDAVVLDMDTPGGRLDKTLEMMEGLDRFKGATMTFVNDEAISAGAYIAAATDEIYFHPKGVIGAAAVVTGTGEDVPETMKQKINSFLMAKVRTMTKKHRYRSQVIQAMMDVDYVLEIDGKVLKEYGKLLSLTADEAVEEYGDPPEPLLGAGIAKDIEGMLDLKYGPGNYTIESFEVTWSEELAQYLDTIAPILLGIGILFLFLEFKTPGFGVFGTLGVVFLLIVFVSNYVAGLAGHEAVLFFFAGLLLIGAELFLFPGTILFGLLGAVLVLGSLLWSMADIWPRQGEGFTFDFSIFRAPLQDLGLGLLMALTGLSLIWRYLPKTSLWNKLVLATRSAPADLVTAGGGSSLGGAEKLPAAGETGVVISDLRPTGEVEIGGRRYQAAVNLGVLSKGARVKVLGYKNFVLLVGKEES